MRIRRVSLRNVRSRRQLEVDLAAGVNILAGPNGAGKTTLLEAVVLVIRGGSLRIGPTREMITRGEEHLRVEVELEADNGAVTQAAAAYARDGERRLTADGASIPDPSRWREMLPLMTFVPDDLRLIKGSPRRRREYLDTVASRRDPGYSVLLAEYDEALAQRNALLRAGRWGGSDEQFTPWERILAGSGLALARQREETLAAFIAPFQRMHADLTGDEPEALRLTYRTNVSGLDDEEYRARLAEMRNADRQRTYTHLGPHRDDLRLVRGGLDVRDCASQGEQRTALLTLVLAEWEYLRAAGPAPLLLLDDVMSELDETRRRALVSVVSRGGQVVITTTDLRYFTAEELKDTAVTELSRTDLS